MRAYGQSIAMIWVLGACNRTMYCCDDRTPPTYAVADATVLDPSGAPASQRTVVVRAFEEQQCSDAPQGTPLHLASLTTNQNGRAVGSLTITPFLMAATDACVSFVVQGGPLYRDTVVSGFEIRFRQAGAPMDTARATITLTAK